MKNIRSVYVALSQNMFFRATISFFSEKGIFAEPCLLSQGGTAPPPGIGLRHQQNQYCLSYLGNLLFPIWEVTHFLVKFLFAKWKTCTSKMFPIREKNFSTVSQIGTELLTRRPMVKTSQGVFPVIDKYKNHEKCICRPIAQHLKCFPLGKKPFLLFPKWGQSCRHAAVW